MTCIVGLVHRGTVWMGADSASTDDSTYICVKNTKVYHSNKMIVGYTSSWRMGQLLQNSIQFPSHRPGMDDLAYITTVFLDAVLTCFKKKGFAKIENNEASGGTFLVGYRGHLYSVNDDFGVEAPIAPYASCGSGQYHANGAMHALTRTNLSPKVKILRALEASAAFNCGVRAPFHVISLSGRERNT